MIVIAPSPTPALVVFGRDQAGRPHASWFDEATAELATKAAGLMRMHAVSIGSEALRTLAASLPKGRVFSSGRAFTPFIAAKLYGQLVELTRDTLGANTDTPAQVSKAEVIEAAIIKAEGTKPRHLLQVVANNDGGEGEQPVSPDATPDAGSTAPATPAAKPATPKVVLRPNRAEDAGIGSMVLATTGPAEGWWEAEVIGENGRMLTLRWRDYAEPTVVRRRSEIGFLPAAQA